MGVVITFEPSGISGLVAEGTYLIDAAHRMGVPLGSGCARGKVACPACLVTITSGADMLSPRSEVENRLLDGDELDPASRLACQVKIETPGELVVRVSHQKLVDGPKATTTSDFPKRFADLPLNQKIATLLQLEAIAMSEAIDTAIQKPLSLGSRALDAIGRYASRQKASTDESQGR
jgi:ferredoxin